jgi:pimeloyl-ACP methyl ester carboxylesterase
VMSLQSAARLVSKSPQGQLHTVPMAGHTVMLDNPAGLLEAVTTFTRENVL